MKTRLAALVGFSQAWGCGTAPTDVADVDISTTAALAGENGNGPFDIDGDGLLNRAENRLQQRYTHQQMGECRAALFGQLDENGDGAIDEAEQTRAREQIQAWMNGDCPFDGECDCQQDQEQLQQRTQTREQAQLHTGEGCDGCDPAQQRDRLQTQDGECLEPPCGDGDMTQEQAGGCDEPPCGDCTETQDQTGECAEPPCGDGDATQTQSGDCAEPPCGDGEMTQEQTGECTEPPCANNP